jgi:primosomal protein N'
VIIGLATASEQPDAKLKDVEAILRDMPALPAEWLALCDFLRTLLPDPARRSDLLRPAADAAARQAAAHQEACGQNRRIASADF